MSAGQGPVLSYAVKTKQGYIPGQKKTNQDAYIVLNNFANIRDHWMMGVCDGHGLQGHLVSNFVKVNLPKILQNLIWNNPLEKDSGGGVIKKHGNFLPLISNNK